MLDETSKLAENKLIILYLISRTGIALSNSEICQFVLEKKIMDYFSVQQYISELTEAGFLNMAKDVNTTRYTLTDKGLDVLNYFISHISYLNKNIINVYVNDNIKRVEAEYLVTANYFQEMDNEYLVKCAVCGSDGSSIMELSLSVATKGQANIICNNWKKNVNRFYSSIISLLISNSSEHPKQENSPESPDYFIDKAAQEEQD